MQHAIHLVRVLADVFKESINGFVTAHVQIINGSVFTEVFMNQFDHAVLEAFALVVEDELCARFMPCLGNRESDTALVRHADYDTNFAFEYFT